MKNIDPLLPLHVVAIFCLLSLFLGVRWGYGKRDRQIARERRAFYKQQEAIRPKAISGKAGKRFMV